MTMKMNQTIKIDLRQYLMAINKPKIEKMVHTATQCVCFSGKSHIFGCLFILSKLAHKLEI